jgi:signal peptidase II
MQESYAGFLQGRVVDMFFFPIIKGFIPEWVPFKGGDYFIFFRPVFNIADAAISVGVINFLLFHRKFFK